MGYKYCYVSFIYNLEIMCFSAGASFGAGIVLSIIGIASIKKAETKSAIVFASIPLIFALQQITEGFLWLALSNPDFAFLRWPTTYIFLFFAQIVWPFWVPFSILVLEKNQRRKKIERVLMAIGVVVSLYLAYCLISYHVEAKILGMHIAYGQNYPTGLSRYGGVLYIIATVATPFFSSIKRMWTLGTAILISYIMTTIFYTDYIVSVWCFFASIISISVLAILYGIKDKQKNYPSSENGGNSIWFRQTTSWKLFHKYFK
jgi:hypothetical protein